MRLCFKQKCVIQMCDSKELCKHLVWQQHSGSREAARAVAVRPLVAASAAAGHNRHTEEHGKTASVLLSLQSQRFSFYCLSMWLRCTILEAILWLDLHINLKKLVNIFFLIYFLKKASCEHFVSLAFMCPFLSVCVHGCTCYFLKASHILIFIPGWRRKICTANAQSVLFAVTILHMLKCNFP